MNLDTIEPRTLAVLGPGGVGGLLAALMARAGHRVICLAGEETTQAGAKSSPPFHPTSESPGPAMSRR